ncbi:protein RD3 [Stegostoma tigrinum]|uniref:protein RD3 n=1 Tax=Stegostoma tigrinum TaxID=3053191 RepID=UPI00202AD355|nr:protein RD3 [Stegostoma tigrinum]XP_048391569.1 protein RD3 [Stegostoma tigrinum]
MPITSWFKWSKPIQNYSQRNPTDVIIETLMMELSWQMKQAEKMQRERENEYRRIKTGVDYSWLISHPKHSYEMSPRMRLELEEACSKIHPSYCGPLVLRFRQVIAEYEPEVHEVVQLFQAVLQDALEQMKQDQDTSKLTRQWNKKQTLSLSTTLFKSRVRIYPFSSNIKTVSEDVEQDFESARRVWSMPEFKTAHDF